MRATGPGQSALLLRDALDVLASEGIAYAVVGAMAASVHGVVRASLDADAVLSLTVQDAPRLERALRTAGFHTNLRRGDADDPIPALINITDDFENRVDFLIGLRGLDAGAFSRVVNLTFHGLPLRVIGLEDFIATKVYAGGPQDLADARAAIEAAAQSLDRPLVRKLAARFGKQPARLLEKLLAEQGAAG